ncbi:fumarylacetoacetate hydrolase family protein [Hyphomonas sp.]|jgi:2-keto-4-pentenoate hydratase/2-oxohepta-3-ene-1,7-dioic acid hydratase in catechol pathway|uniref:fumarylacetoacetate hydrolase family protein n=1 Tax=Hyphomonas sp. TaxID=87 RepID=UPI0032D90D09
MKIGKIAKLGRTSIIAEIGPEDWRDLTLGGGIITVGAAAAALAAGALAAIAKSSPSVAIDEKGLVAPIDETARILCAGFNFGAHATESGRDVPPQPTFFSRFPTSLVGNGQPITRPAASESLDWEGEVALMIGLGGRHIPLVSALDHVAGYCPMGEHSVREYQLHGTQATAGKNFDGSGGFGPFIVSAATCPTPSQLEVFTHLNGVQMQHGQLSDLIFDIPKLINYISTFITLRPGDIIATGTPPGIGGRMTPPRWLVPGDTISVEIPGVGKLTNSVVDE